LGATFARIFREVAQIFMDFAKVFTDFAQIPRFLPGFSGILPGFSPNQNFGGAIASPASPPPTPLPAVIFSASGWMIY